MTIERIISELQRNVMPGSRQQEHVDKLRADFIAARKDGVGDVQLEKLLAKPIPPETAEELEKKGFIVTTLTGHSIRSLSALGLCVTLYSNVDYPKGLEFFASHIAQVAFNRNEFVSTDPHYYKDNINDWQRRVFGNKLPAGIKIIEGDAADFIELSYMYRERLFPVGHDSILAKRIGSWSPVIINGWLHGISISGGIKMETVIMPLIVAK